ncbi:MAG: DUF3520 domain-containing protein [Phycisphaerales bacterium]
MNREQAESLLAQLVFDDLEEPLRTQLLEYLKTDPELNERLGDMRLTAKLLHDAVAADDAPKLDETHKAGLAKQIDSDSRKRGVIRVIGFARMHPAVAALLVISTAAILIGVLLPATGSARRAARQMKNTTQVRGIVQGLVTYAGGNKERMPGIVDQVDVADQPVAAMETGEKSTADPSISDLNSQQARIDTARRKLALKENEWDYAAATDEKAGVAVVTPGQESSDRFAGRGYALNGDTPAEAGDDLYQLKDQVASSSGTTTEFYSLDSADRRVELQQQNAQDGADQSRRLYAQAGRSGEAAGQPSGGAMGGYGGYVAGEADRSGAIALNESSSESTRGDTLDFYYGRQAGTVDDGVAASAAGTRIDDLSENTITNNTVPVESDNLGSIQGGLPKLTETEKQDQVQSLLRSALDYQRDMQYDKALERLDQAKSVDPGNKAVDAVEKMVTETKIVNEARDILRERDLSLAQQPDDHDPSVNTQAEPPKYPADWPLITSGTVVTNGEDKTTLGVELKPVEGVPIASAVEPPALGETNGKPTADEEQSVVKGKAVVGYSIVPAEDPTPARKPRLMPVNPWVMTAEDQLSTFAHWMWTPRRMISLVGISMTGSCRRDTPCGWRSLLTALTTTTRPGRTTARRSRCTPRRSRLPEGTVLKIGVRGKVVGRDQAKPANLVFVIDTSGSMDRDDRLPLVRQSLAMVLDQLSPQDRVSVVSYGTEARLLVEAVPATEKMRILDALESLQTGGSTNLLSGVELGYEVAQRQFITNGVNRVILNSDGVANVGPSETQELVDQAQTLRKQGVTFTSVGFGAGNYDDEVLEQLANKGDGGYLFVGSLDEAKRVFVDNLAATRPTIAFDAKIQVNFDPARVRRYRLIGYENRDIADTDFRNDTIDAGEVGSGQSATALYEVELLGPTLAAEATPARPGHGLCPLP